MKIHIVKKGDTLWEIAKQYNVDFEQLKQANSQLSSPDMIMPGMKITIPSNAKPVKKENTNMNMKEKEKVKTPYKDISPKPMPVVKEDEKEKPIMKQKPPMHQKPSMHQMPAMDQDFYQNTTINFTQMPPKHMPKKETKPNEKMPQMMPQMMPQYMPVPMCCYPMHPQHHQMHHGNVAPMHMMPPMPKKQHGCGCDGVKSAYDDDYMKHMYGNLPEMEMPKKPKHTYADPMMPNHQYDQNYPKMGGNKGYGNPYPTPPGFQPFPTANFRDDEEESDE